MESLTAQSFIWSSNSSGCIFIWIGPIVNMCGVHLTMQSMKNWVRLWDFLSVILIFSQWKFAKFQTLLLPRWKNHIFALLRKYKFSSCWKSYKLVSKKTWQEYHIFNIPLQFLPQLKHQQRNIHTYIIPILLFTISISVSSSKSYRSIDI